LEKFMAYIRKRGKKWQAIVRKKGYATKTKSFHKKADAVRWAEQVAVHTERPAKLNSIAVLASITLGDLLQRYLIAETPKKKSAKSETYRIRNILKRPIARLPLSELTTGAFASYRDRRLTEVGPQGVIHELNCMSVVLRTAKIDWDIPLTVILLDSVRRPKMPTGRSRRLEEGEYDALRRAALAGPSPYIWDVISFAIETAMRQGEIRSLGWDDISFDRRIARLKRTKNGDQRAVPLTTDAIQILHRCKSKNLPRPFPYTVGAVRNAWDKATKRAGISNLRLHDLRHEGVSRFFERGLSVPEVALISGHKDFRMLARYTHLRADDIVMKL
jgi:integrase